MAKKAAKKEDSQAEAERKAVEATPPTPTISKAEAVRRAIAAGAETPAAGVEYLKKHFDIEMDNKTFSLNRSQYRARLAKQESEPAPKGKPGRKPKQVAEVGQVVKMIQPSVGSGVIADLAAVKALVDKLGVNEVVEIAKLFG